MSNGEFHEPSSQIIYNLQSRGPGTPLGHLDYFRSAIKYYTETDDVIRAMHSFCYYVVGETGHRISNLARFQGFEDGVDSFDTEERLVENRRKWNIKLAHEACDLLGLDKTGSRTELCRRIASFCMKPCETKPSTDVPSGITPSNSKKTAALLKKRKRQSEANEECSPIASSWSSSSSSMGVQKKAEPPAFIRFSQRHRSEITRANPTLKFGEISKILAAKWRSLDTEHKKKWRHHASEDDSQAVASAAIDMSLVS